MTKGFWTLIDELAPSLPDGGDIEWSTTAATIVMAMQAQDFEISKEKVCLVLANASESNPGWQWKVEEREGRLHFRPART